MRLKIRRSLGYLILIIIASACGLIPVAQAEDSQADKTADFIIPVLQIPINTVKLTQAKCTGADNSGECEIPWIAQYIKGIYDYGLGIGGILAAVVLMGGGVLWLVSAGDASKITQAKDLIIGSLTGMIILTSSYLILDQINPNLINLKPITLNRIEKIEYIDTEVTTIDAGENPYQKGCDYSRKDDYTFCKMYGTLAPTGLVEVPGTNVKSASATVEKYTKALDCVKKKNNGKQLFSVNESWRSASEQLSLWEKYNHDTKRVSRPCCSNHGSGKAMDLKRLDGAKMTFPNNVSSGLTACMNAQGLYANLSNEPWHWSPSGR